MEEKQEKIKVIEPKVASPPFEYIKQEQKSSGVSGSVFDGLSKTLEVMLYDLRSKGIIDFPEVNFLPNKKDMQQEWIRKSDIVARVRELLEAKRKELLEVLTNKEPKIIHGTKIKVNKDGAFTYNIRLDYAIEWFKEQVDEVLSHV